MSPKTFCIVALAGLLIGLGVKSVNWNEVFRDSMAETDAKLASIERQAQLRKAQRDLEYAIKLAELNSRQEANNERIAALDSESNVLNAVREELQKESAAKKQRYQELTQMAEESAAKREEAEDQLQRLLDKRLDRRGSWLESSRVLSASSWQ